MFGFARVAFNFHVTHKITTFHRPGDDWKKNLKLPPKDLRMKTSVGALAILTLAEKSYLKLCRCAICVMIIQFRVIRKLVCAVLEKKKVLFHCYVSSKIHF